MITLADKLRAARIDLEQITFYDWDSVLWARAQAGRVMANLPDPDALKELVEAAKWASDNQGDLGLDRLDAAVAKLEEHQP